MSVDKNTMKFGVTEAGDAGINFEWLDNLQPANIIITKQLTINNTRLINGLLDNKDRIILHCTCTGYGGTEMERNVPNPSEIHTGIEELIKMGFPTSQIVLRTDPIIPTKKGIEKAEYVWRLFSDTGITRCRFSIIDLYPHAKERIIKCFHKLPFNTFKAPQEMINNLLIHIKYFEHIYQFESCAENTPYQLGCISQKDLDILGIDYQSEVGGFQRRGCLCIAGKTELLRNRKRCPSQCLYCYWKD